MMRARRTIAAILLGLVVLGACDSATPSEGDDGTSSTSTEAPTP
jgi:hypothetical protein